MTVINFPDNPEEGDFIEVPLTETDSSTGATVDRSVTYYYTKHVDENDVPILDDDGNEIFYWKVYGNSSALDALYPFVQIPGDTMTGPLYNFDPTDLGTHPQHPDKSLIARREISGNIGNGSFDLLSRLYLPALDTDVIVKNPPVIKANPYVGVRAVVERVTQAMGGEVAFPNYTYTYDWQYIQWYEDFAWNPDASTGNLPDVSVVKSVYLLEGGSGYTADTDVATTSTNPDSTGFTVDTTVDGGVITDIAINQEGTGYLPGQTLTIDGGTGARCMVVDTVVLGALEDPPTAADPLWTSFSSGNGTSAYILPRPQDLPLPDSDPEHQSYYVRCVVDVVSGSTKASDIPTQTTKIISNIIGIVYS